MGLLGKHQGPKRKRLSRAPGAINQLLVTQHWQSWGPRAKLGLSLQSLTTHMNIDTQSHTRPRYAHVTVDYSWEEKCVSFSGFKKRKIKAYLIHLAYNIPLTIILLKHTDSQTYVLSIQ